MTLSSEMSRITRVFGEAHTSRTKRIGEIRRSVVTLSDAIALELKVISRHVAATRSAASSMIKRYKAARPPIARALREKLKTDHSGLAPLVNRFLNGLNRDRVGAKRIYREYLNDLNRDRMGAKRIYQEYVASRKAGAKQSAPTFNRAAIATPAVETVISTSVTGAPAAVVTPKS